MTVSKRPQTPRSRADLEKTIAEALDSHCAANVRFWRKADIPRYLLFVRFRGQRGHLTLRSSFYQALWPLVLVRVLADEPVTVGHLHLGQRLRVDHVILADDLVEREDVGSQCVDFIVGECLRLLPRHRPARVVEVGRGIGPIVPDQLTGSRSVLLSGPPPTSGPLGPPLPFSPWQSAHPWSA